MKFDMEFIFIKHKVLIFHIKSTKIIKACDHLFTSSQFIFDVGPHLLNSFCKRHHLSFRTIHGRKRSDISYKIYHSAGKNTDDEQHLHFFHQWMNEAEALFLDQKQKLITYNTCFFQNQQLKDISLWIVLFLVYDF